MLRQKTTRNILLILLTKIVSSRSEIGEVLEKDPTTIVYHLKRLKELDIIEIAPVMNGLTLRHKKQHFIERSPVGREVLIRLKDPHSIYEAFINYQDRLMDDKNIKLLLYVIETLSKNPPKKLINSGQAFTEAEKAIFEIFPHPYHV